MKRTFKIIIMCLLLILSLAFNVKADTLEDLSNASGAYTLSENLPDEVNEALEDIGLDSGDFSTVQNLSFSQIVVYLLNSAGNEAGEVLPSVCVVLAILLLYAAFGGVFESVSNPALSSVLSVVSALCIACVLLLPVSNLIETAESSIKIAADFMLSFIPVMTAVLISSGQTVTGSGYCAMMVLAAEGVGQLFSKVVSPLLSCFLTLGISSSIVPDIKLSGLVNFFSKTIKWLMSFIFTLFTALLTLKSLYSSSVDNISSRALRYTMSSFVPVVGGALSEAYRTVHGSVGVLKSGVGVFVIIAIVTVFIPVIIRLLVWLFTVNMCKSFAETTNLNSPMSMLTSISTVLSLLLSVIFCIIALFIITTALIMTIGGVS